MLENLTANWKRRFSQVFFLFFLGEFSFYGIFRCPFAVPYVNCGNCPVLQCPGRDLWIPVWIALLVSGLCAGRLLCGWGCPGGLVSELMSKLALFRNKTKNFVEVFSKHIVTIVCLFFVFVINNPRWAIPIRTGDFFRSVSLTFEHANEFWLWRTGFIIGGFLLALVIPHFWCRYLCPTGGLLEILNKISLVKYLKTSACNDCDACKRACTAETRPAEVNCVNCGDCSDACPTGAIKLGRMNKRNEKIKAKAA